MPQHAVASVGDIIVALRRFNNMESICINGHGETTIVDNWMEFSERLSASGCELEITTNLAKVYSVEELRTLAKLARISVSIDTADRTLLRRVRRRVDVERIIANITRIRGAAIETGYPEPRFTFLCGLYDKNSASIGELATLAIVRRVYAVVFWNLNELPYKGTDIALDDRVHSLDSLDDDTLSDVIGHVNTAVERLVSAGVMVDIVGNFIATLSQRNNEKAPTGSRDIVPGMTRDCTDPWRYLEFRGDGDVLPCCARSPIGHIGSASIGEILNGQPARDLRRRLLEGDLDHACNRRNLRSATTLPPCLRKWTT